MTDEPRRVSLSRMVPFTGMAEEKVGVGGGKPSSFTL